MAAKAEGTGGSYRSPTRANVGSTPDLTLDEFFQLLRKLKRPQPQAEPVENGKAGEDNEALGMDDRVSIGADFEDAMTTVLKTPRKRKRRSP